VPSPAPPPDHPEARRIGVLGGTFDPVHVGHLVVAVWARDELQLDQVLLVVANDPWQKRGRACMAPAEDRYAMVCAALEGLEGIEASRLEIDRGGPSYTVETLRALAAEEPSAERFLIVGADLVPQLSSWHEAESLASLATLVVATRPGAEPQGPPLPGLRVLELPVPRLEVSSSALRARLAKGASLDVLVPAGALDVIRSRRLYQPLPGTW
jgi:nicotinate-nucleotide adenylyltransferase